MGHQIMGHLGAIFGPSLGHLGAILGPSWAILGPSWAYVGATLGNLGVILGPSWGHLGPSWGYFTSTLLPADLSQEFYKLVFRQCELHVFGILWLWLFPELLLEHPWGHLGPS